MLKFAVRNLLSRPLRSLLSLLGLTVAIVGMVGLFSVAEGLDQLVTSTFGRIPGLMVLQPGAPIPLFSRLPASWEPEIAQVRGVRLVNSEIWQRANVIDGKSIVTPPRFLFGTDIATRVRLKRDVYQEDMIRGRFLEPDDRGTFNAVVSTQIAEEFGKDVGDRLSVNGHDMEIVGVYHCGSLLLDVAIILDIDQVRRISGFDADAVCGFYVEQSADVSDEEIVDGIRSAFRGRSGKRVGFVSAAGLSEFGSSGQNVVSAIVARLHCWIVSPSESGEKPAQLSEATPLPGDDAARRSTRSYPSSGRVSVDPEESAGRQPAADAAVSGETDELPIEIRRAVDWAERFDDFTADLDLFLLIMTSIGVAVAVLSIINTMFMSVAERLTEFGILKANGWSRFDVMKLITFESGILGLGGGVLGALVGWMGTHVINWSWPDRIHLFASPGLLAFGVGFATFLGVVGGLYPAIWAMRMQPMEAIRRG